jgi:hypothetical protein
MKIKGLIFGKTPRIKCHENPFRDSRDLTGGQI